MGRFEPYSIALLESCINIDRNKQVPSVGRHENSLDDIMYLCTLNTLIQFAAPPPRKEKCFCFQGKMKKIMHFEITSGNDVYRGLVKFFLNAPPGNRRCLGTSLTSIIRLLATLPRRQKYQSEYLCFCRR